MTIENPKICIWTEMGWDHVGNYDTSCGEAFSMIDGTPGENKFRYCCFCGGIMKGIAWKDEDEDEDEDEEEANE